MDTAIQILVAGLALMFVGGGSIYLLLIAVERACDWLARQAGQKNKRGH